MMDAMEADMVRCFGGDFLREAAATSIFFCLFVVPLWRKRRGKMKKSVGFDL
jgi:hypothetical protein